MTLGPKCYNISGIWALKPHYLGPWTLRDLRTLQHVDQRLGLAFQRFGSRPLCSGSAILAQGSRFQGLGFRVQALLHLYLNTNNW